jgi:putative MATE family efflux protein
LADRRDLTHGSVAGHLARLGLPMVFGIIGVLSISLADAYFLGRLGTQELAAISFTFPVVLTLSSLGIGLSAGAASVTSRAIGAGDRQETKRLATDSLVLAFLLVACVAGLGYFLARPLFSLMGAEGGTLEDIVGYMQVYFLGLPFLVVPMVANGLIRANGDSVVPSGIMILAAVVNVGLDPVFIYGLGPFPRLEVEGAAWASVTARALTFVAALGIVIFREKLLSFALPRPGEVLRSWARVLAVGVPAAGSNVINPVSITIVTGFLSSYGEEAVAAFGVATRIESFASIPMLALSSAIGPVSGQNWGGGSKKRALRALKDTFLFCAGWAAVIFAVFWFFAEPIAGLFAPEEAVRSDASLYLKITALSLAGYGVVINAAAAYNATGRAVRGLGFTATRSALLYVPLAGLAVLFGPLWAVFAGIAAANVLSGAAVAFLAIRGTRPDEGAERNQAAPAPA